MIFGTKDIFVLKNSMKGYKLMRDLWLEYRLRSYLSILLKNVGSVRLLLMRSVALEVMRSN